MARLYKTASANPLDYMYRINSPLMEKVIGANDAYITQNLNQTDALSNAAANFPYLQADEARAKEISDMYSKQISTITDAIREDPANWRKQLNSIKDVSRNLQQDYRVGEVSKISGNYTQYKKVADYIDEQVKEYNKSGKGISGDRARAYKEHFLKQFTKGTAYDPNTGEYNAIKTFDPMGNIDVRKRLGEELDKIKADKTKYKKSAATGEEWYFNDKTNEWEGVSPQRILSILSDRLNDPQLMSYLAQESEVGLIKGVFNEGKLITPYGYAKVAVSPEEQSNIEALKESIGKAKDDNLKNQLQLQLDNYQKQLEGRRQTVWNDQSYLSPILRGLVDQHSYSNTSEENTLRNNSKGSTKYTQAQQNFRQGRELAQAKEIAEQREKGLSDRAGAILDFEKYKFNNPQDAKKGTTTKGTIDKGVTEQPLESSVSKVATNSFETWMTTTANNQKVKVLSNAGLSSDIDNKKKEISKLTSDIATLDGKMKALRGNRQEKDLSPVELFAYNNMRVQKEGYQKSIPQIESELNARRQWYKASVEAVLNNNTDAKKDASGDIAKDLTPEEIKIYREGEAGMEKNRKLAENYLKKAEDLWKVYNVYSTASKEEKVKAQRQAEKYKQEASKLGLTSSGNIVAVGPQFDEYKRIKKVVDTRRDNFLAQIRYTPIETDAIQVGKVDSESLAQMIFANTQGLKFYDNTGNKADNITLEGKGVSWFAPKADNYSMTAADNSIVEYMTKHNVVPVIEQVGNTTKIGTGNAIVKVTFKDPNKEIPTTPFYIELTPELQKQVGTKFKQSQNKDVQDIANSLLDNEANEIRRQLITPKVPRTAGASNFDPVTTTVFIRNGNTKIPFQVTKLIDESGEEHLSITGADKNGVQVPLGANDQTPDKRYTPQSKIPGWFNGAEDFIDYIKRQRQK